MKWLRQLLSSETRSEAATRAYEESIDPLLDRFAQGEAVSGAAVDDASGLFVALYEAVADEHDTDDNCEFPPVARARFYANAVKLAALWHPEHLGWPMRSRLRERVLVPLMRRYEEEGVPWLALAAIQPCLANEQPELAEQMFREIDGQPFLTSLARRWATHSAMSSRHVWEREASDAFLNAVGWDDHWNRQGAGAPAERWIFALAMFPDMASDPRTTWHETRPTWIVASELAADWDIYDRDSARNAIRWLAQRGNREAIARFLSGESEYGSEAQRAFFAAHKAQLAVHGGLAWDLARVVMVARQSLTAGYLALAEVREVMDDAGQLARAEYVSWSDFAEDCALAYGFNDLEGAQVDFAAAARWMATHPKSPCQKLTFGGDD